MMIKKTLRLMYLPLENDNCKYFEFLLFIVTSFVHISLLVLNDTNIDCFSISLRVFTVVLYVSEPHENFVIEVQRLEFFGV